jgi:hypothetical protein
MAELNRVHNWVDAIVNEDGGNLSAGSLKTLVMIKNRATEQAKEIVDLRKRSREAIDELEKKVKKLEAEKEELRLTLMHVGKQML